MRPKAELAKIRRYHAGSSTITKFEEQILSTSFLFLYSPVKMLKFTSIVGYTSRGPTYIKSFLTIFGQCINVLNHND